MRVRAATSRPDTTQRLRHRRPRWCPGRTAVSAAPRLPSARTIRRPPHPAWARFPARPVVPPPAAHRPNHPTAPTHGLGAVPRPASGSACLRHPRFHRRPREPPGGLRTRPRRGCPSDARSGCGPHPGAHRRLSGPPRCRTRQVGPDTPRLLPSRAPGPAPLSPFPAPSRPTRRPTTPPIARPAGRPARTRPPDPPAARLTAPSARPRPRARSRGPPAGPRPRARAGVSARRRRGRPRRSRGARAPSAAPRAGAPRRPGRARARRRGDPSRRGRARRR